MAARATTPEEFSECLALRTAVFVVEQGVSYVSSAAASSASPFYLSLGYEIHGEPYLDEGLWHRDATKELGPSSA